VAFNLFSGGEKGFFVARAGRRAPEPKWERLEQIEMKIVSASRVEERLATACHPARALHLKLNPPY
jgi:hypothetical protein